MRIPRVLIGGVRGKIGKTVISIGLMLALQKRGLKVQPFKVGPDFIDSSYHSKAAGRVSRNFDGYLMTKQQILQSFIRNCSGVDIAIIEGVMGLFDSINGVSEMGSTAEIAKILRAPIILVVDAERMSRTAARWS